MRKAFATLIALFTAACLVQSASAETVRLKFASFVSPKSVTNSQSVPEFIKAVEEASQGTLKIDHYPGGTLGSSPKSQLKLVEDGVVDIAEIVAVYTPNRFPEFSLFELPFEFTSSEQAGLTSWKMYEKGYFSGMENLEVMGIVQVGPYTIHTRKDASTPEQMDGMKLRAGGPIQGEIIQRLEAIPIGGISATAVAEAISRRVLDGCLMDAGNLFNFRISDATSYHVINVPLGHVTVFFPMNKKKYESLPPKAKAALDQYRGEWFTGLLNRNLDKQIENGIEKLRKDDKHTVIEWSQEQLATVEASMSDIKDQFDKENSQGVNLYKEMKAARDAVNVGR